MDQPSPLTNESLLRGQALTPAANRMPLLTRLRTPAQRVGSRQFDEPLAPEQQCTMCGVNMRFTGASRPLTDSGLQASASLLGTGLPEVWTLLSVETRGCGFLQDRRPVMLFERHIFHRQTGGKFDRSHPAISSAEPGGYLGGADEYRHLEEASNLDAHAALMSASWGIGQIMGFNAQRAGFASVNNMVDAMQDGEDAQLHATVTFLRSEKLNVSLAAHEWKQFALAYNGADYEKNLYDKRLASAYAAFSTGLLPQIDVRQVQMLLMFLGIDAGGVDGIPGKRTRSAVARFRSEHGLGTSTIIDDALIRALSAATTAAARP